MSQDPYDFLFAVKLKSYEFKVFSRFRCFKQKDQWLYQRFKQKTTGNFQIKNCFQQQFIRV